MSSRYPDWEIEGRNWPNRAASAFVMADGYRWHVQTMGKRGKGPVCLLIHGTGAATHSWRDVMPLLARDYRVIAIDLPGHGFTRPNPARKVSLPAMAASLAILLEALDTSPQLIVGHSAGAAIAAQLLLDRGWHVPLIGLTPALMPFPGLAAKIFPGLARMLFVNPFVSQIFAKIARTDGEVAKFLRRATGSQIDAVGLECYQQLFGKAGHCDGAIRMMANWDLEKLRDRLGQIAAPVLLVHADQDSAIPRSSVEAAARLIPDCRVEQITGLGHLAHEEAPERLAQNIVQFAQSPRMATTKGATHAG